MYIARGNEIKNPTGPLLRQDIPNRLFPILVYTGRG